MFSLAFYGNGGFPINALYDLPVQDRKYYIGLLNEALKKQNESAKTKNKRSTSIPPEIKKMMSKK